MKIESYSFGKIKIDSKKYSADLIIYPDRIKSSWWRKEGHLLQLEDLEDVLDEKPDVLIIGTGYSGLMKVPEETKNLIKKNDIKIYVARTTDAVKLFNEMQEEKRKIIAALHLTC